MTVQRIHSIMLWDLAEMEKGREKPRVTPGKKITVCVSLFVYFSVCVCVCLCVCVRVRECVIYSTQVSSNAYTWFMFISDTRMSKWVCVCICVHVCVCVCEHIMCLPVYVRK